MAPWLSILIPVYNVQDYLVECLVSIIRQCDSQIEIILLDDKSTDYSLRVLNEFSATSCQPLKILQHNTNMGLSAARNTLLESAKGDYLWFIDSDDVLADGAISQLKNIVENHSPDLIMCDFMIWRPYETVAPKRLRRESHVNGFSGKPRQLLNNPSELFHGLYRSGKMHAWSKISKRSLWSSALRFPQGKYFEDMVTSPRLAAEVETYYYCPEVWVKYRQRQGSILATPTIRKVNDMIDGLLGVLPLWLRKYPSLSPAAQFAFLCFCLRMFRFCLKDLNCINTVADVRSVRTRMRAQLYTAVGMSKWQLCMAFLKQRDLKRFLRVVALL